MRMSVTMGSFCKCWKSITRGSRDLSIVISYAVVSLIKLLLTSLQNQQIKMIEETKLTSKKRKGVAHFVKYFPIYVSRIEQQLIGADGLEIRANVDLAYEKIVHSMFECLKHMATLDGDDEDKGQLNYHVLLVGK
jgi:hypothetical protein